ncbi:cobalamin B12-binding domain-containing protein [Sporosarcina oncorhynchi]|uniref:Cobalamin B12-binding domain-containing protein n=1 Tax=Sporosarcina oncorhynchi TaxID=3056444 RepID=A0ABZ0L410_9BACL|nr:cobalamin B12-binding domain-containing protein [Sporosarcina sp. T2O-4]WOV87339.1 cobalamin B12-binding domain-containing protein [Sporosarcina sp. T2O-4]
MTSSNTNGRYYIQQVSDMTGLSKQVIRKWEERYSLVQPDRLDNGYRIYSKKDINLLLHVKMLSEQGMPIRQAVKMVDETEVINQPLQNEVPVRQKHLNEFVLQLLEKGSRCDEKELMITLQQANHELGLASFLKDIVIPFLQEVGNRWEKNQWDEYQESVSSLIVRDFLVQIRRNYQYRADAPLIMAACLPNELHEVPLHILLLQFMLKGWRTFLIGAYPAPGSIEALIQKMNPQVVVLSATTTLPFEKDPLLLTTLDAFASIHPDITFYLGGKGAMEYASTKTLNNIHLTDDIHDIINGSTANI